MHSATGFLEIAALLVVGAFCTVALCSRLGMPTIVGYLVAGVAIGPSGLGLVTEGEGLSTLGEIGVIMLLFTLGLEFSFPILVDLRRLIFGVGALQVVLTTALFAALLMWLWPVALLPAVLIGGAFAMSSTALCLKTLASAEGLGRPQGRLAIAVLLFQDLAAVVFLVMHDAALGASLLQGVMQFVIGAAGLVAALFLARRLLQSVARWISASQDSELAQLLALSIALLSAMAAIGVGLSPALGAFAAGMMISESDARNVVEKEIRPFRDLLVGIFFVGIGTQLALGGAVEMWDSVLLFTAALLVGKFALTTAIIRFWGEPWDIALRSGLIIAHGGEFGLMLTSVGLASGLIDPQIGAPLLLAIGVSMFPAAVLVRLAAR